MEIKAQMHIHTCYSAHAYSTVGETAAEAARLGIGLIAITDHGPDTPDSGHVWHFGNMGALPHNIHGVNVLRGAEANIIDYEGGLDLSGYYQSRLDFIIASYHRETLAAGGIEKNTAAYVGALSNPYVDALGHCGWSCFEFDLDAVLSAAKKYDKLIEINNQTFTVRPGSAENCKKIARRCAELGVKIMVGADAHSAFMLNQTERALALLEEIHFPEELVMNTSPEKMLDYLCARRGVGREEYLK